MSKVVRLVAMVSVTLAVGCVSDSLLGGNAIRGRVVSPSGSAVPDAILTEHTSGATAKSDGTGRFELLVPGSGEVIVEARAFEFASTVRRVVLPAKGEQQAWILHPVTLSQEVQLPAPGEAPLHLEVQALNGGSFGVDIPGGSLVDPAGNMVTGPAHVEITYWNPHTDQQMGPGSMLTERAPMYAEEPVTRALDLNFDGPSRRLQRRLYNIDSFGMADLVVSRNGTYMNVDPNGVVTETWRLADEQAVPNAPSAPGFPPGGSDRTRFVNWISVAPQDVGLWSYDNRTDLWNLEADMSSPKVKFDQSNWTLTVEVSNIHDVLNVDLVKGGPPGQGTSISPYCASSAAKHAGDTCSRDDDCCPQDGSLSCSDGLCVPAGE
ncbi:MAG TPA: carboxypeptidase-like regulatory domain-containing protein [Myxococcota bacterium]|nr:carboxypeptidase-like regulatory domain-containing protein [Myxococcota bacterium]